MSPRKPWGGDDATPSVPGQPRVGWVQRRKAKVLDEIERNRRGEYTVPTWVLATLLVVIVAAFVGLILYV